MLQFGVSAYYSFKFDYHFILTCGVSNGYKGATQERFQCVYDNLGYLDTIAKLVLIRPVYSRAYGLEYRY